MVVSIAFGIPISAYRRGLVTILVIYIILTLELCRLYTISHVLLEAALFVGGLPAPRASHKAVQGCSVVRGQ